MPSEPEGVVEKSVEDETVEGQQHGHTQSLEPKHGLEQDHYLECHDDNLQTQQPSVHAQSRVK